MFKKIIAAVALAFPLTLALSASASDTVSHPALCNPQPADVSKFIYNKFGIINTSASAGGVACGAAVQILSTINNVEVQVFDRHTTQNVSCTLTLTDIFSNTLWSGSLSSSGSGTPTQNLSFTPGVGTHTLTVECSIPAQQAGLNPSGVASYRIITP